MRQTRVLHVDDDAALLDLAAAFLDQHGLSVTTAESAAEGLRLLETESFDCVVSDYQMPEMDGLEFLQEVRTRSPDLPFVLFTGEGSEEIASDAIAAGVTDYLRKERGTPQFEVLANRVERAVAERRTEHRLDANERMLRALVEDLPGLVYRTRVEDDRTESLEGRVESLTGFPPDRFTDGEMTWRDLVHEDDTEWVTEAVGDALEAAEPFELRYRIRTGTGEIRQVSNYGRGVPLDDPTAVEGFIVPAGETVDEQSRLRALHDSTRELVGARSVAAVARATADATREVLGYPITGVRICDTAREVLVPLATTDETQNHLGERPVYDVTDDATEGGADGYPALAFRTGEPVYVQDTRTDGRATSPAEPVRSALYYPLGSHGTLSIGALSPDAFSETDRQLAAVLAGNAGVALDRAVRESDLEAERDRLAALFENIPDPTVRVRYDGDEPVVEAVNPAFEETFGYEEARLLGQSLDQFIVPPSDRAAAAEYNDRILEGEGLHGEVRRVTADGLRDFILHVVPYRRGVVVGEDEDATVGYAIYTDITERKERERELERQNERLEEFAGVVSHDLRNPLNVAEGRLELARETGADEHFDAVERSHERMRGLIEGLLELARQGRRLGETGAVSLGDAAEVAWGSVEGAGAELVLDGPLPTVVADRDRLSQLLENLLSNAVEHGSTSHDAGDTLTVTVGALADGDGFYVADDGVGIRFEDRDQVFDSGFTTADGGTGFGLAIVRSIAEAHGWTVSVTESDDGGARFEFTGVERAD
ncbi:response regulator [Salinirubellus salinus]|uniref:histidine kinase n=1 Tax=Salinirubellus salinus TaxID=1364945 RepID=A0A9E7R2T0_9EURY|nr:response regulator [Salinirubellus salinus]UWM54219.1 response regulator [Salinirubellus salinus]